MREEQVKRVNRRELLAALQVALNQLDSLCAAGGHLAAKLPDARTTSAYQRAKAAILKARRP